MRSASSILLDSLGGIASVADSSELVSWYDLNSHLAPAPGLHSAIAIASVCVESEGGKCWNRLG